MAEYEVSGRLQFDTREGGSSGYGTLTYRIWKAGGGIYMYLNVLHDRIKTLTVSYSGGGSKTYTVDQYYHPEYPGMFSLTLESEYLAAYVNNKYTVTFSGKSDEGYTILWGTDDETQSNLTKTSITVGEDNPNTAPSVSLSVPSLYAGTSAKITWSTSDAQGDTVSTTSLIRHYKPKGASSYESTPLSVSGSARSYTDSIPASYADGLIFYTVTVSDGQKSASAESSAKTVISNRVPTISGSNGYLGEFALTAPTYSYSVSDPDGGTVSVKETIDGVTHKEFTATLGTQYTVSFTDLQWLTTLNGDHTITITATDPKGASATRTMTFTKNVTSFSFTLATPLDADDMITKCAETLTASIPEGAYIKIEVCNNGYDDEPMWEDVTESVLNRSKIFLSNDTKTADKWGYNIRVTVSRLEATGECWAFSTTGYFE